MPRGDGPFIGDQEAIRSDFKNELDRANRERAAFLESELDNWVSREIFRPYLNAEIVLPHEIDPESLTDFITFAHEIFRRAVSDEGFSGPLEKYIGHSLINLEFDWREKYSFDPMLLQSEVSRFKAYLLASAGHMDRGPFDDFIRTNFLVAYCISLPEIPRELSGRINVSQHRVINKMREGGDFVDQITLSILRRGRENRAKEIATRDSEKIKSLIKRGTHPIFAERWVKNQDHPADQVDIPGLLSHFPNPNDLLLGTILGKDFSSITDQYFVGKEGEGDYDD